MQTTSIDALNSIDTRPVLEKVRAFIQQRGPRGATCYEAETALGLSHQTASARITQLRKGGQIKDSGRQRKTGSGRNAIVWVVPPPSVKQKGLF